MTDAEIRGRLLKHFYDLRHANGGSVPATEEILAGSDHVRRNVLATICRQLAEDGLIAWERLDGENEGHIIGVATITGHGVDVVEGRRQSNIEVRGPLREHARLAEKEADEMRDTKLLRELLKRIAADSKPGVSTQYSGTDEELAVEGYTTDQINQHLEMLLQMGLVNRSGSQPMVGIIAKGVSPAGYDLLEIESADTPAPKSEATKARKVFIVHGHDDGTRELVRRFLEKVGFEAIILHEQASQGRTIIEKFVAHSDVGFAVVLLTPDDEGCEAGGTPRLRARQNVVLELGYFVGKLGRDRVLALRKGDVEIPSDFAGVVYENLDIGGAWRLKLGQELEAAGYNIDWNKAMKP